MLFAASTASLCNHLWGCPDCPVTEDWAVVWLRKAHSLHVSAPGKQQDKTQESQYDAGFAFLSENT